MAGALLTSLQFTDGLDINAINRVTIVLVIAGTIVLLSAVLSLRKRKRSSFSKNK